LKQEVISTITPAKVIDPHEAVNEKKGSFSDALLFLAAFHGRAITRDALLSGLPIEGDSLTVALFGRAALRAGLEVELVERALSEISAFVLPVVLIFRDRSARVLTNIDAGAGKLTLVEPATLERAEVKASDIESEYLGYAFFVRPAAAASERALAAGDIPKPHWFWGVARRFVANYSHIAIAAFIVNILALAAPLFTMSVYDRIVPNGAVPSLIALGIGLGIAIVFDFLLRIIRARIIEMTGKKLDVILAAEIFEHILSIKMAQRPVSIGILANQIRDFDSVREFFTSGTVVAATDLFFAAIFIVVLFIIGGPLGWIPVVMLPAMVIIGLILQRPLNRAVKKLQAESSARHGVLVESLASIETVRAAGAEARMQSNWEKSVAATARSSEHMQFWSTMSLTSATTAQQFTSLLMVFLGVFLILDGQISQGALIAANMLAGRALAPISGIAAMIMRATQTFASLRSIDKLMGLERERPQSRAYLARQIKRGSVVFDKIQFKYPKAAINTLENVSFSIRPGERVGIIGRIGSGKTTVGRLLSGFYDPDEGRILIDDVDVRQYDPADLRRGIGFVLQDIELFFGTLRDNIALGFLSATDEQILEAARLAGVEQFAATHPLGYNLPIAEGGRSLSGGQKQAIGLARALIRKPQILFLDEPTAHFDIRSEAEFIERLKVLANSEMTILVSTHRLSVLALVDRLLVFERGQLIADGPRDQIIAKLQAAGRGPTFQPQPPAQKNAAV
jgi:ATP-binding cassette, subfamily C, bacterial LapB